MNKNKNVTRLFMAFFISVAVIGALFFFVESRLGSKEIEKNIRTTVNRFFPHADVEIGEIHLKLGTDFKVGLESFTLKNSKKTLFTSQYVTIRVPLVAFLVGGGNVDILLDRPQVFYKEVNDSNNWLRSLDSKFTKDNTLLLKERKKLPIILRKSKVSLRANDMLIEYDTNNEVSGLCSVKKIMVKNLGLETVSGLEVVADIKSNVNMHATLISSFRLSDYLKTGELKTRSLLKLSKIMIPTVQTNIRSLNFDIHSVFKREGPVQGTVSGKIERSSLSFDYSFSDLMNYRLSNIQGLAHFEDIIFDDIRFLKSKAEVSGDFSFAKGHLEPNLKVGLMDYYWSFADSRHLTSISAVFNGADFTFNAYSKFFEGELASSFKSQLKPMNRFSDFFTLEKFVRHIKGVVDVSSSELPKSVFNSKYYISLAKKRTWPKGSIMLSVKNSSIADVDKFSASGTLKVEPTKLSFNDFLFSVGDSTLEGEFTSLYKPQVVDHELFLSFKDIKGSTVTHFLKDKSTHFSGIGNGLIKGQYSEDYLGRKVKNNIEFKLSLKNGRYFSPSIKKYLASFDDTLKSVDIMNKPLSENFDGGFKTIAVDGSYEKEAYFFNSIKMKLNNNLGIEGQGILYRKASSKRNKSELYLTLNDLGHLTKIPGKIPLLFKGSINSLKPDYQYTMSKVLKKLLKKKK